MKVFLQILAFAAFLFAATAVETRASERLDVNPPPLLEQISTINSCELTNAHETPADIAATSGTVQIFVIYRNASTTLLRPSPEATPWAIAGTRQFAAMSTDDYKMLDMVERPPRLRQFGIFYAHRCTVFHQRSITHQKSQCRCWADDGYDTYGWSLLLMNSEQGISNTAI